jgi:hypothetical protein
VLRRMSLFLALSGHRLDAPECLLACVKQTFGLWLVDFGRPMKVEPLSDKSIGCESSVRLSKWSLSERAPQ